MPTPLESWVEESARLTKPSKIVWCDGSQVEIERLTQEMLHDGTYIELNQKSYPGCHLHRSNPNDVARTEGVTFICSHKKEEAGPTNNWMAPDAARERVRPLFDGAMKGRTMYVVPYILGPAKSPYSKVGVEITDSAYVVASMHIMSRMGKVALDRLGSSEDFVPGLHSLGDLNPDRRFILHFPEERLDLERGLGLRRQCPAGEKMLRAANRKLDGARSGLDGRAHVDHRARGSVRQSDLHGGCISKRLRKDKSGHDGFRTRKTGLSRLDHRRRYRLDAHRIRRHAARD